MKVYKLFRVSKKNKGKLFPLFVLANKELPMNKWIEAECGEMTENGKVKSRLGSLAYRPGYHSSTEPLCTHIGKKGESGEIEFLNEEHVWCECEIKTDVNYQLEANENGINKKGILIPKNAYLKRIPVGGYYRYKTNPNMTGEWIISGEIKINRVLTDAEVRDILKVQGLVGLPRYGGDINLEEYGFAA